MTHCTNSTYLLTAPPIQGGVASAQYFKNDEDYAAQASA